MSNQITAYFKGRTGVAEPVYQNDYGMVLNFDGIYLPSNFDCHFSVLGSDTAIPGVGADNRVAIPNTVLSHEGNVTVHIPLHTGSDDSEVEYVVYFKVIGRARPEDDGTPVQMTAIERALALLSQPITNIEEIVNEALSFTGETFDEMRSDLQGDYDTFTSGVNDDIEDMQEDIAGFKTEIRGNISDVESNFTVLQGQFDTAVAAVTTDTEVTDIRVGADGVTDTTAGASVRRQFTALKEDYKERFNFVNNKIGTEKQFNDLIYRQGHIRDNGTIGDSSYHCRTDFKQFGLNNVEMVIPNGYEIKVAEYIEDDSSTFTGFVIDQYKTGTINFIAKDTRYYCIAIKRTDDSTLNPSTVPDSAKIYNTYLFTDTSLTVPNKPADAKQTGNKISEINNTLAGMIVKSPNLFDPSTDKKSWWVNSTTGIPFLDTDANYGISDYISIKKNTTYGVRACIKVWFYDVNHTYISLSEVPSAGKVFGPYTEDRYVILGYREALLDSVTLMESSEIPNITPYENPYINNDYIKIPSIVSSDYDLDHNTGLYFGTVPTGYYNGHNSDYTADGFSANTSYTDIISKFDALVDGGYVTKQDLGVSSDGTNHIYEYDFIPTACPLDGSVGKSKDVPTVLIVSGQHGFEKASIYGLYYFLKDLCTITNDPIITYLRNHVKIKTIPAANPYGINNGSYCNANGVNLNRNYDTPGFVGGGTPFTTTYGGETAGSEAETQAICNFITNNPNAVIMADFHTQGRAAVSSFDRICWLDFAPIKDDYFNLYRYMGCAHVENLTAHFINDYSLSVPYGTLCGRCSSGESGYTATFPSVDVWSLEHGIVGHTIEGFTGFPNSSDYSGDALKANSEIIGNWIIAVMYGTAHIN